MGTRQGDHVPELKDGSLYRSKDVIMLLDQVVFNNLVSSEVSDGVPCQGFRHFGLFLRIKSSGAPTDVRFIIEFYDQWAKKWYVYKQGLFASLYYEDADTATEVDECFSGDCAGRQMRVRVVATGTTSTLTFTVSAAVELWN